MNKKDTELVVFALNFLKSNYESLEDDEIELPSQEMETHIDRLIERLEKGVLVLLKSDHPGEDGPYTIGAIELQEEASLEEFEKEVVAIMDEICVASNEEYEDEDLMVELERRGYTRGDVPYEIVVRD